MNSDLDTSQARSEIFKRIRDRQGRSKSVAQDDTRAARQYIEQHAQGPKPSVVEDLVDLFVRNSEKMLCTVEQVPARELVPSAVRDYLTSQQLEGSCVVSPALKDLKWKGLDPIRFGQAQGDDLIGISDVAYAVAETGSLVLASRAQ
ncbi:MAG: lactate utilization protein C, partial [Limnobacter sp.]|nr:lactate utilization protein C [Limnobacter sp.]